MNEWFKTETIRDNINLDAFLVMPNRIHGIIEIINKNHRRGESRFAPTEPHIEK
jgi:REP element-mobilizing transposase RayT